MILQIDNKYFNPDQVTVMVQDDNDVRVYQSDTEDAFLRFENWKVDDLAAAINRCIEEFQIDNFFEALKRFNTIGGLYSGKESIKTQSG